MRRIPSAAVFFIALSILCAETVKLRDGSEMKGKIVKRDETHISLDVDGMVLDIPFQTIDSIDGKPVVVKKREDPVSKGETTDMSEGKQAEEERSRAEAMCVAEVHTRLTGQEKAKIARWERTFREDIEANKDTYENIARSGKAKSYYLLQLILDPLISMYGAIPGSYSWGISKSQSQDKISMRSKNQDFPQKLPVDSPKATGVKELRQRLCGKGDPAVR